MFKFLALLCASLLVSGISYADYLGPFTAKDTAPILARFRKSDADTSRVMLAVQLSDQYYYRVNRNARELDSSLYYTAIAEKLGNRLGFEKGLALAYFQLAAILPLKNRREKGLRAIGMAARLFSAQKNYAMQGEAYFRWAGYYGLSDAEKEDRLRLTRLSLDAFRSAKLPLKEGAVLQVLGDLYSGLGENGAALSHLKQCLQVYQSVNYKALMGVYDLMGNVYTALGAPEEGIKYGILALRSAKASGDTSMQLATIYNRMGITHYTLHEYEKSIENYRNSLGIAEKYKDIGTIYIVAANLCYPYVKLRRYAEAKRFLGDIERKYPVKDLKMRGSLDRAYISLYREQRQFDNAATYINELLMVIREGVSPDDSELIYTHLIEFYFAKKDYALAIHYLGLRKKLKLENLRANSRGHLWQSRLDSIKHQYLSALSEFQKYSVLKDSFYNETKSRQVNQLEIIYETEKKEENIALLKKESALQQRMLQQASRIQNITYLSIALLLIIIGLLVYGYRLVRKNNRNMAARQEEINNKNVSLGRLLTEKEWLMKEIHHRVKNNLHMIVGLLESQSEYLKGDEAKIAMSESQNRIQAMSMIHQKLYQTDNLTSLEISEYIHEMVQYLKDSFNIERSIAFHLDIERVKMNINYLIPLGLILNEAITNSIKYAFPGNREGRISVRLTQPLPGEFVLDIADNGIGIKDEDLQSKKINSFGLSLIRGLCEDIGGRLTITGRDGTAISIGFSYAPERELSLSNP